MEKLKELFRKYPWAIGAAIFLVGAVIIYYYYRKPAATSQVVYQPTGIDTGNNLTGQLNALSAYTSAVNADVAKNYNNNVAAIAITKAQEATKGQISTDQLAADKVKAQSEDLQTTSLKDIATNYTTTLGDIYTKSIAANKETTLAANDLSVLQAKNEAILRSQTTQTNLFKDLYLANIDYNKTFPGALGSLVPSTDAYVFNYDPNRIYATVGATVNPK